MNTEATTIYSAMRLMARGTARDINARSEVSWCGLTCVYYPMSGTWNWFGRDRNITRGLRKQHVLSLINQQLEDSGYQIGVQKLIGEGKKENALS